VQEWLDADAARLRTLVHLTGGNPRTTVLLFHLVLDGLSGGAREYLEQLLDQCTPNYKGRVDELPPQAQQVLDSVALKWDPVTAMEVAADTGLETTTVSTQLTRLVRQGILEKADPGDSKKALYQVAERFFNIWYLMRASRRVRAKLRWFVEFLRVFFESGELEKMAWERLATLRSAGPASLEEMETAFAYLLASGAEPQKVEEYLRRHYRELEPNWMPLLYPIPSTLTLALEGRCTGAGGSASDKLGIPHPYSRLQRAVGLAQLDDFPRAIVALDDDLTGDPIEQLSTGRKALEVFFAAAVRNGRVRDCIELLDRKEWKDAWRPIYEALKSVEAGSADYLKRVAVEIREPALIILRRIAPELPGT
jgi:hypothetical protein